MATNGVYDFRDLNVESAFKNYFFLVPDYQREYVWEADKQVAQLLADMYDAYSNNNQKEYFIGTTVVYGEDGKMELIDGQQRTTTIFLILCAFKKIFSDFGEDTNTLQPYIYDSYFNDVGVTCNRYRLVLQYPGTSDIIDKLAKGVTPDKFDSSSAKRLFESYEFIYKYIRNNCGNDITEIRKLFVYFFKKLKYIQIFTPDINDALKIFETINDRGVGLNPMDLLKNLIFQQIPREEFNKLKDKWKELMKVLEDHCEKPLRFLRYFIVSNYPSVNNNDAKDENTLREDQIYEWMRTHADLCGYKDKPYEFVDNLLYNAKCYVNFAAGKDAQGNDNVFLRNIRHLGGSAFRQHLILFLAARDFSSEMFNYLAKAVETYLFYFLFTREQAKIYEKQFGKWDLELVKIKSMGELVEFVQTQMKPQITRKESEYKNDFLSFAMGDLQTYRVRYILAKLSMYIDSARLGKFGIGSIDNYLDKGIEIEHIAPFTPTEETLSLYPDMNYDRIKTMLGNLTLLEQPINGSIHNDEFAEKVKEYAKSKIYLTSSIANVDNVGVNTAINRTNSMLKSFDHWDAATIAERQEMLYNISLLIWNMD